MGFTMSPAVPVNDIEYIEEHLHHNVRWFTKLNPQTATEWCTPLEDNLTLFYRATSGNATWGGDAGDESQLFGTADVPISGMLYGDFNEILVVANSSNTLYFNRIVYGTGTLSAAITAGQYSEFPFFRPAADNNRKVMEVPTTKIPVTIGGLPVKIWLQTQNATDNATLDFIVGVHGYEF